MERILHDAEVNFVGRDLGQIHIGRQPATLAEFFRGFTQSIQAIGWMVQLQLPVWSLPVHRI
jgi:hypothetical protein